MCHLYTHTQHKLSQYVLFEHVSLSVNVSKYMVCGESVMCVCECGDHFEIKVRYIK